MGTTTSPVVTDTIEADANGKIFINTMDNGPHGSSLAWIRIRAVGSEPPLHIDFSAYTNQTIEFAQADLTSKFSSVSPQFLVGSAIPIIGAGGMNGTGGDQGIATESSYIGSDRTALDAFNNSVTSEDRWQTGPGNGAADYGENEWIKFDVGNNRNYIECYRIWARSGTNSNEALERAQSLPRDWRIEGSDDDVNWTILDTRTGINNDDIAHTSGGISSAPYKEYKMQNPGTYRYYRLWVLSTNNIIGVIISELAYYGRSQATSSNSNFEYQKTAYIPGPGQINFWHYSGDNTPATFKCISDRDGKCIIVYGCLWTNESVKVYVNGSLHSETTFTSDTTTISVSTGDVIEITESQSVMGLHSITFLRQLSEPVNRYVWSNDAGEPVPTNNRINLISYGELNNNFNFSGKFTIRFTWETNSYSNNSTIYEMINGTDTSGEYGGLTGYRDTSNYGIIFRVFQRYEAIHFDTWPSSPRSMNAWPTPQSDIVGKHEYKIEYDGNQETCKLFIDGNEKTKTNPQNVVYFTSLPFYSADSNLYITAGGSFFDGGSTSSENKIYYYEYLEDIE